MSDVTRNKDLVVRFVAAGNERDMDTLDKLLAPNFKRHCPATPDVEVNCPDDFKRFLERDVAAMPDSNVAVTHLVAEDDKVAVWATYSGTQEGAIRCVMPAVRAFPGRSGCTRSLRDRAKRPD